MARQVPREEKEILRRICDALNHSAVGAKTAFAYITTDGIDLELHSVDGPDVDIYEISVDYVDVL